jgi:mono/diheme cytochrome c family protein
MLFVNHLGEYSLDEGPTGVLLFCKGWPHERRSYEPMRFLHLMTACALLIGSHVIVAAGGSVAMDRTEVARGKQIFVKYCAGCHGSQGKGDGYQLLGPDPANLMSPTTEERSDDDLLRTIHEGKPNMPAWKHRLSRQHSRDVLTYIRSLSAVQRK